LVVLGLTTGVDSSSLSNAEMAAIIDKVERGEIDPAELPIHGHYNGINLKRAFEFGLGKKDYPVEAMKRAFEFGLGRRGYSDNAAAKRAPYSFGLGKKSPYEFGLGKRSSSSEYDKRAFEFGLGKRAFEFGLGKKAFEFGLGKRAFEFGLGKKAFEFGLGKKDPKYGSDMESGNVHMDKKAFEFGLGKKAFEFGLGKKDLTDPLPSENSHPQYSNIHKREASVDRSHAQSKGVAGHR